MPLKYCIRLLVIKGELTSLKFTEKLKNRSKTVYNRYLMKVLLTYYPSCPSAGWSVACLVCHNFLKWQEVTLV